MPDTNFEALFKDNFKKIRRYFIRKGVAGDIAEELAQEAFLRLHRGWEDFREEIPLSDYLLLLARRVWINHLREIHADKREAVELSLDLEGDNGENWLPSAAANQEDEVIFNEAKQILKNAVNALPAKPRQVAGFRIYQNLSFRKIALLMNSTEETVKSQLSQATKKLKEDLGDLFAGLNLKDP